MRRALAVPGETLTGTEENVWPECGQSIDDKCSSSGRELGRSVPVLSPFCPLLLAAAPDPFSETLPSAHGVAELFNFIVLLLRQLSPGLKNHRTGWGGVCESLNPGPAMLETKVTAVLCHTCPGCRAWWSSARPCRPQRSQRSEKGQAGAADLPYGFCHPEMLCFLFLFLHETASTLK